MGRLRSRVLLLVGVPALTATVITASPAAAAPPPIVAPPAAQPNGLTYGEWGARWWQYALSFPLRRHPFLQTGQVNCGRGQIGNVWLLPGSVGTARRECSVPAGTALLLPVMAVECSTWEAPPFGGRTPAELRACASKFEFRDLAAVCPWPCKSPQWWPT